MNKFVAVVTVDHYIKDGIEWTAQKQITVLNFHHFIAEHFTSVFC